MRGKSLPILFLGDVILTKFLSKDPEKALVEVKEELFDRLNVLRQCLGPDVYTVGWEANEVEEQMINEVSFLEDLLDMIERS